VVSRSRPDLKTCIIITQLAQCDSGTPINTAVDPLVELVELQILSSPTRKQHGDLWPLLLDFQKAFDKVPHQRLLWKLEALGITGKVSMWIAPWLKDRQQRVVLNGHKSSWIYVLSGVPQVTVMLFIIFINDLDEGVTSKQLKLADNVKLIGQVGSEVDVE